MELTQTILTPTKMANHKEHLTLTSLYLNNNNVISGKKLGGITCGTKQQNGNTPHMVTSEDLSIFLKLVKIDKNQVCQKCLNILKSQYSDLKAIQAKR